MPEFVPFPKSFQWGTATAAYQIEGAVHEDGRSDSIWDTFARTPDKILNNDSGDIACDHYHRWKEDIQLMKDLGYKAYRFSLAWPRILPDGCGKINQAGLDFYDRLIDELLRADIFPLATLYHWDLPAVLPDGWVNRSTVNAFVEYTGVTTQAFGDRVKNWITINEPFCASLLSYKYGMHAPGLQDPYKALTAAHHLLLAHGAAVPEIRANCTDSQIGIALNQGPYTTPTRSQGDLSAARFSDGEVNRCFLYPLYGRRYPADMLADYIQLGALNSMEPEFIKDHDFEIISVTTDFLAVNYYTRNVVKASSKQKSKPDEVIRVPPPENNQTEMGWEVFPYGLYETVSRIHWEYRPGEIIVTENGASYADKPDINGKVHDEKRIAYLKGHIQSIGKAIQAGVPVSGYYVWSLMDNFEWSRGYSQRFGLVYIDYTNQKRIPKDSAAWYRQVIRQNGLFVDNE